MSPNVPTFFRALALGMLLAVLGSCGNESSPTHAACAKPPYCPTEFMPAPDVDTSQPVTAQ